MTNTPPLEKKDEIVANVIWRFLELRGYVFSRRPGIVISLALVAPIAHLMRGCDTNLETFFSFTYLIRIRRGTLLSLSPHNSFLLKTHDHSPMARAMHSAIRQARLNDKFQDSLYLFLELVRAGVMHGHLWSGRAFSGGPSFGTGKLCLLRGVGVSHVQEGC